MSVRIVRLRSGEDVICDLYEVTTKENPKEAVALRMDYPYNITILEPDMDEPTGFEIDEGGEDAHSAADAEMEEAAEYETEGDFDIDDDGIFKMTGLDVDMRPWAPLSSKNQILIKLDDVVSAYETFDEVSKKYNELVEAAKNGRGDATTAVESNPVETKTGVPVGEGDRAGRGAKLVN